MNKVTKSKTYFVLDNNDKKAIKKQMIDLNLSSTLLARNLGVSNAYISSILNGQRRITEKIIEQLKSQGVYLKCLKKTKSNISDTKWHKLKEFIKITIKEDEQEYAESEMSMFLYYLSVERFILNKMQELEGENDEN